jgi:ubiquitin-protein ligase
MASAFQIVSGKNSIKRIVSDLNENSTNKIDGVEIFIPDDDNYFKLHCQIRILHGIYKDIIIHSILHIPPSYPIIGPAMNIAEDFVLPSNFHHHILGKSICNDMLTNFKHYFETIDGGKELKKASGWSSG